MKCLTPRLTWAGQDDLEEAVAQSFISAESTHQVIYDHVKPVDEKEAKTKKI